MPGDRPARPQRHLTRSRAPAPGIQPHPQPGEEAGHRAAVTGEPGAADVPHLEAQAVRRDPRLARVVDHVVRLDHLGECVGREQPRGLAAEEARPPRQVGHRGPQLAGGGHRAGVVLRLGQQQVGERVHGQPLGRRSRRPGGRAGHAERLEQLAAHDVEPAAPVVHLEEPTEGGVADVGVVEAAPGAEALPDGGGDQRLPVAPGRALPPRPGRLGLGAGGVGEQLLDGDVVEGRAGRVRAEPVGEVEPPGVAQPQHAHGDEGLGDRAHPVLRVGVGRSPVGAPVDRARGAAPDEPAAAHQPGRHRGQPAVAL